MHPNDAEGIANSVDPDQTAPLIWVCTVCPDLSVRKLRNIKAILFLYQVLNHLTCNVLWINLWEISKCALNQILCYEVNFIWFTICYESYFAWNHHMLYQILYDYIMCYEEDFVWLHNVLWRRFCVTSQYAINQILYDLENCYCIIKWCLLLLLVAFSIFYL